MSYNLTLELAKLLRNDKQTVIEFKEQEPISGIATIIINKYSLITGCDRILVKFEDIYNIIKKLQK